METISNCESFESLSAACGKTGVRKEDNVQLQNVNSTIRVSFMVYSLHICNYTQEEAKNELVKLNSN